MLWCCILLRCKYAGRTLSPAKLSKAQLCPFLVYGFFSGFGVFFNCIQLVSLYSSLKKSILSRKFQTLPSYSVGKDSEIKSKEHIKSENICIVSCLHCFIFIKPSKACFLSLLLWFVKQSYVCLFPPPPNTWINKEMWSFFHLPHPPGPHWAVVSTKNWNTQVDSFFPSSGGIQVLWYIL